MYSESSGSFWTSSSSKSSSLIRRAIPARSIFTRVPAAISTVTVPSSSSSSTIVPIIPEVVRTSSPTSADCWRACWVRNRFCWFRMNTKSRPSGSAKTRSVMRLPPPPEPCARRECMAFLSRPGMGSRSVRGCDETGVYLRGPAAGPGRGGSDGQAAARRAPDVRVCPLGREAAARRSLDESELDQVRLDHVLHRVRLLADRGRERRQADRPSGERLDHGVEHGVIQPVQSQFVHLEHRQAGAGDVAGHPTVVADLGHVTDPPKETVGDPRGPTGSSGDLVGPLAVGADVEDPRAPEHDLLQVPDVVVVQARAEAEALAERKGDPPRTGSGPDQRETRQLQADRPRRRTLAEHHVEREVLEGRVEHLLDGPRHAVDLVDEEHVALPEVRQDRGEVARALQRGAGGGLEPGRHLVRDDLGERGLAEPRRAAEQQVVNGFPSFARRLQEQCELFLHTILPDELSERAGTQG